MITRRQMLVRSGALAVGLGLARWPIAAGQEPKRRKVLFFSKSSNFEHAVIKQNDGQPSFVEKILSELGPKHAIEFTYSKDGSLFTPDYLAKFDAYMFYTSGDLLSAGKDGNPPMTPAGKTAFLDAIKNGKGFVGLHSATDTFHTDETAATDTSRARTWRYRNLGERADPYTRMIGAEFLVHSVQAARDRSEVPGVRKARREDRADGGMVFIDGLRQGPSRSARSANRRHDRRAVQTATVSVHMGANARQGPSLLHVDGASRGRLDESHLSESDLRRDLLDDRQRRCGRFAEHRNRHAKLLATAASITTRAGRSE
jgi:hypothetical protein